MANNVLLNSVPLLETSESGETLAPDGFTAITAAVNVWQDYFTFTLPSAGTWDVTTVMHHDHVANVLVSHGIKRASGSVVFSAIMQSFANTSSLNIGVNGRTEIATTGPETLTVVVRRNAANTANMYSAANGPQSKVYWKKIAGFVPAADQVSGVVRANSGYIDTIIGGAVMRTVWGVVSGNPMSATFEQPFAAVPHLEFSDGLDSSSWREYRILTKSTTGFTAECRFSGGAVTTGSLAWRATGLKP